MNPNNKETDKIIAKFKAENWSDAIAAANKTDLTDQYILVWMGYCHYKGYGVERDYGKAISFCKKSAKMGNTWAMRLLGFCYKNAPSEMGGITASIEWFRRASERGDKVGQRKLAEMYENGEGVAKDIEEAFFWYLKSAENGDDVAQFRVGVMYADGNGTEKNIEKAFRWYKRAAEKGNADAQNRVGVCYSCGNGVERSKSNAFDWYRKAAGQNHAWGMANLASCYENGSGTGKNVEKAFRFYSSAAEIGNGKAMFKLGYFYENGIVVDKNADKAVEWYGKAASAGYKEAKNALDRLRTSGVRVQVPDVAELNVGPVSADLAEIIDELNALIGLEPVKKEVRKFISLAMVQKLKAEQGLKKVITSNHLVFTGNPGTGKTTVARIVAKVFKALGILKTDKVVETDRAGLVAGYIGQTAIKTNKVIDSALDGVLFIDEAYSIANGGEKDYGHEAVDTLLKRMEDNRDRLVVIVAGYTKEMKNFLKMNPGLESRFTRFIDFPNYSADELTTIFMALAKKAECVCEEGVGKVVFDATEHELAKRIDTFANARFVRTLFEKTIENQSLRLGRIKNPTKRDLQAILVQDVPDVSALDGKNESIADILTEMDGLVGIAAVKEEIRNLICNFNIQKQRKEAGLPNVAASYHCVFSGNPGTGKTTVARYMARIYKALGVLKTAKLIEADRSKLVAEYVGQTAVKTNAIIDEALNGVLFIDEAYTLSDGGNRDFGREAVDTLLKRMEDDRDRLVVIIAGYTAEIEGFLQTNPGLKSRFTRFIEFPDYSSDELAEIFARMASTELFSFSEDVTDIIRRKMESLVESKSTSFGNARTVRTYYEKVKARQAVRLAKLDRPSRAQMTELLAEDVSIDMDEVH